jgi:ABC-2 type transport system permease protein
MVPIIRKELSDYFHSTRFFISFLLVLLASAAGLYAAHGGIREALAESGAVTGSGMVFLALFTSATQYVPPLIDSIGLLIPIIGIALGFDAVNSERTGGTLSRIMAQPVYRDGVINGKFLAGIFTMVLMVTTTLLLVSGLGLRMIGVPPSAEEIVRIFLYLVLTIIYGAFWMGLAILFSVIFRRLAGSLLMPLLIFIFFYFFWMIIGPAIANSLAPVTEGDLASQIHNAEVQHTVLMFSPSYLFEQAYQVLLIPMWAGLGILTYSQAAYMIPNPLSLGECLLQIWPHMVVLATLSIVCFAITYVLFMRQEVRA